jgi:hypothetical protein
MESYTLPDKASYSDIEDAFQKVKLHPGLKLTLPNLLGCKGGLGVEGLLCQLIATWIRVNPKERVYQVNAVGEELDPFKKLCSSLYGTCALKYSSEIYNGENELVDKNIALEYAYESVRKVNSGFYYDAYQDQYATVFSFKSPGPNKEYNNKIYLGKDSIDRDYVRVLVREIISALVLDHEHYFNISEFVDSVSAIVSELFDNTHNHSRHDVNGSSLAENFRAIIIDCSEINSERLIELTKDGVLGMSSIYTDWDGWMKKNNSNIPILDITVVDSGPGYARRWTSKEAADLSWREEVEAIERCFTKNFTTTKNYASGSGLSHVMRDVKKLKGWFTLRTGRALVSKSFHNGQGKIKVLEKNMKKNETFVEGVSFNISVPLVDMGSDHV